MAEQGWANWTFELDDELIVRFPRDEDVRSATQRELRLLPALAAHVSFRVPSPVHATEDWFVYEKIQGRPLQRGDDIAAALAMIDELHTFPIDEARRLLDGTPWMEQLAAEEEVFTREVFPLLDDAFREDVAAAMTLSPPVEEALIHYDLGPEHVLVDDHGRPVGMIDFEEATVGDPEPDHMPILNFVGRPLTERMWRYRCRGTLHALVHYTRCGESAEIPGAVAELRHRVAAVHANSSPGRDG